MAAAFAALVSLYNNIPLIWNHPRHSFFFEEKQLRSLWVMVCILIGFMRSFNNSHGAAKEAAEALESRIARAVQAAEDVIESHVVDQIRGGSTLGRNRRYRFLLDLQKAIQDVDFIGRKALNVQKSLSGLKSESVASSTPLVSEKNTLVGFDDQLLQLLDQLTGVPSCSRRVIPIEGMGGIGKTTLAINAYQHPYIVHYFDVRLWATISQEFSVYEILKELLASLSPQLQEETRFLSETSTSESSVADLGLVLHKSLYGRRYLIILDDMWSVEAWDEIKNFFPDTRNGSRIVVTTRLKHVAHSLSFGPKSIHVRLLDKDSSWDLFCKKTFEDDNCPSQLEDIGKTIVAKCGGLPLPIIVIGGHLRKSPMVTEYWENIAYDMSSVLNSRENEQCLNILSLSYKYLSVELKPCFLFLGVFPEDKEIPVLELLNLWIAEGFIVKYENQSLEDIAWILPSSDYCLHNLSCFEKLESLKCRFDPNAKWHDFSLNLTFPNSLEFLQLSGCHFSGKEVTMKVGFLPHLEILDLVENAISGSEWSLVEGELFPRLKKLFICHHDLIHWNANEFHFPVLEHLGLQAPKLDEFPSGIGDIPTLRTISLRGCSMSSNISASRMIAEQI